VFGLERALAGLTATERRIVQEYLQGSEPKEISEKLGVSVRTVYKALYKYRRNLREMGLEEVAEKLKVRSRRMLRRAKANSAASEGCSGGGGSLEGALAKVLLEALSGYLSARPHGEGGLDGRELYALLRELNENIAMLRGAVARLSEEIAMLRGCLTSASAPPESGARAERSSGVPSYLLDNPWVEVLRMRGRE